MTDDRNPQTGARARWVRRVLAVIGTLVMVLAGLVVFLLGTAAGGRLALDRIILPLLPDDVDVRVADMSGRLWGDFELLGGELRLSGVEARAERVTVRFRPWALLGRRVDVSRLEISGLDVHASAESSADTTPEPDEPGGAADGGSPPLSGLPVAIAFDTVLVRGITGSVMDSVAVTSGRLDLSGTPERFSILFEGTASEPAAGDVAIELEGIGSTTSVQIDRLELDALSGTVQGSGSVDWWPELTWEADLRGEGLEPATLMEDPAEWPGSLFMSVRATGAVRPGAGLELEATVDTLGGTLRGESAAGQLSGALADGVLSLSSSSIVWGPASVRATGSYADTADLDFEASVPDLGLLLPGSSGRVRARGRVTGSVDGPRIVAEYEARDIDLEAGRATVSGLTGDVDIDVGAGPRVAGSFRARQISVEGGEYVAEDAEGRMDLDLSARGVLSGDVVVRSLVLAGERLDSVTADLSGNRPAHVLEVAANGPAASFRFEASGGLSADDTWRGIVAALEVVEDSLFGSWALADSVELLLSADSVRLGTACLLSGPARVCAAGSHDRIGTSFRASASGLDLARARPFLPDDLEIDAVLSGQADLVLPAEGPITGRIEASTTGGEVTFTQTAPAAKTDSAPMGAAARTEPEARVRTLLFKPISLVLEASPDSVTGWVDLALSDSAGTPAIVLTAALNAPALDSLAALLERPASTRFDLRVADVSSLPFIDFGRWDAEGGLVATGAFDVDERRNVSGALEVDAAPVTFTRILGTGGERRVTLAPARLDVVVDAAGTRVDAEVVLSNPDRPRVLVAEATADLPGLNRVDADLASQPIEGHVELTAGDIAIAEGVGDLITEAEGSVYVNADVDGTLGDLSIVGEGRLRSGRVVLPDLGLELTGMQLTATGAPDGSLSVDGEITSGPGRLVIEGRTTTKPSAETPTRIAIRGEQFQILNRPEIRLRADPNLELVFDGESSRLTGEVRIPRGRFEFSDIPEGAVTRSSDVVIVGDTVAPPEPKAPFGLDILLTLGNDIFFSGFGLTARLGGNLRIRQDPGGELSGRGEITLIDGTFRQFGQDLRVEPGRIVFSGPLDRPSLDVRAFVRARDGTEAGLQIGGTPEQLTMETYSRPQKSESETMSYILFGRGLNETSGGESNQASNAAAVLGANVLTMSLAPSVGLDEARIETGSRQDRAQFVLGKYLTPRLYVGYGVGLYQPISTFRIRYLLSSKWSIESITGDERATDLLYRFEVGKTKTEPAADDAAAGESGAAESGEPDSDAGETSPERS